MSTEEQQILNIKVNYEDAIYGIVRYKEKLDELKKAQEELKQKYEDGKVTYDEYATSMAAIEEQAKSHKATIRELSKEVQNNIKVEKEQEGSLKSLRAELANAHKEYAALSREEREGAKGKEMEKHITAITKEVEEAEEKVGLFQRRVGSYEQAIKSALGVNGEFASSLIKMSADGKGLAGVFEGAITNAKAFGKTLVGFMTNPVFIALAGITGVGVAFKWFFDYNKGILESTRLTREFLGLTGDSLEAIRNDIQATADTYGKDYKETLEAVDVLTSQYGYDAKEALQIINDGFQSGADLNGDMIAKIKQYAPAFHDASISGKELVGVIQQTRSGIFSNGGMDLIQMASKKIREMSSKTAGSLDAIGISSKKVQKDLESGATSTFDVIKMVSTKLKEIPQNSQAVGNVLKDVFGKQGANAGLKMIEQLDTMNIDLNKLKDTTGEYGKRLDEQREANEELNSVMSAMFDMSQKGFGSMIANAKLFITRGIISMLKGIMNLTNKIIDLYNESAVFRGLLQLIIALVKSFGSITRGVFNVIIDAAKMAGRAMKGLAQIVEGLVTFSWSKIKEGFATAITGNFTKTLKEGFSDVKKTGSSVANNFADSFNKTLKNKKIEHIKVSAYVKEEKGNTTNKDRASSPINTTGGKASKGKKKVSSKKKGISVEEMAKKEEEAIRKAEDLLMQLIEQSEEQRRKAIEVQYDRQIEDVKRKLEREKGLTVKAKQALNTQIDALEKLKEKKLSEFDTQTKEEALKREETYISNMLASVEKGSKEEYDLKVKSIQTAYQLELEEARKQVMNEEDKSKLLRSITEKYYKEEENAYKEHKNKLIDEQTKAIEDRYKEKILKTQIESNGTDELGVLRLQYEEKQALLEAAQQKEGETIEEFNARKLQMAWEAKQKKQEVIEKEIEIESAKYQAISQMMGNLGQVAEAFGEQSKGLAKMAKVIALGEIAVNTGVALAAGIKQAQSVPFPGNIAAIATTVTQILAGIASAVKTVKSAKFAKGGLVTGAGSDTSDSIPAQLSNGESVLTASATRMFAPALSAFNQIGGGVPIVNNFGGGGQQIGEEFLARAFARGMAMMPRPVVSVEEINKTNSRVETIERLATLS